MSLAFAHLNQAAPDVESAEQEARAALRLQPEWSYVKDILLPQIEKARAAGGANDVPKSGHVNPKERRERPPSSGAVSFRGPAQLIQMQFLMVGFVLQPVTHRPHGAPFPQQYW
jgi:hypothetical protein